MKSILSISLLALAIPLSTGLNWQTDITTAKEISKKDSIPIVLVFQGSDWCAPCIKLEREIFSKEEFTSYAKDNYVMLKADFPRKKKNALDKKQKEKNNKLAEKYNKNGYFPYVVVLDSAGKVLGSTGYKKTTPKQYIKILDGFIK